MKYVKPFKLKVLMILFFGAGTVGIAIGLGFNYFFLTFLGTINLCLGGFVGWLFLTQTPKESRRKRK